MGRRERGHPGGRGGWGGSYGWIDILGLMQIALVGWWSVECKEGRTCIRW